MSRIERQFDDSRASQAGAMYAQKHYKSTLFWVFLHRWSGPLGVVAFVLFVYWMGQR